MGDSAGFRRHGSCCT